MAEYIFEDMTAEQAFGVGPDDLITVRSGSAMRTTVIFTENALYQVTIEGKTLLFPTAFRQIADGSFDGVVFPDDSRLHVGDSTANAFGLTPNPNAPVSGAAYGGGGGDSFTSGGGDWLIQGNQGNDFIQLARGRHTVYGGQDNDVIRFENYADNLRNQFVQGNKGDDTVGGAGSSDTLLGGQGNDQLDGGSGLDYLNGNLGDDRLSGIGSLFGEGGDDTLVAKSFDVSSWLEGGVGNDSLSGSGHLLGGDGNDEIEGFGTLLGGDGDDTLAGPFSEGSAFLDGGSGNDRLSGSGHLVGGDGDDGITGSFLGSDTLEGGSGNDRLIGSLGEDSVNGGPGNDTIYGSEGGDSLAGGSGSDRFQMGGESNLLSSRFTRIIDWSIEDKIAIRYSEQAGTAQNYAEFSAENFSAARAAADDYASRGKIFVAAQLGGDVVLFAKLDSSDGMTNAYYLVGRTLSDIAFDNIISPFVSPI